MGEEAMSLHEMQVLDRTGHTTVTWDSTDEDEVRAARETFEAMRDKGYAAFGTKGVVNKSKGETITAFDATLEEIILVPPIKGG
jgi:hypothetical protein